MNGISASRVEHKSRMYRRKKYYEPPGDTRTHIAEKSSASNIVLLDALEIIDQLKVTSAGIHVVGSL